MNIFRRNKIARLTNEEKVSHSKTKVESALGMFTKIYGELEEANTTLETVIEDDSRKVDSLQKNIENANNELISNKEFQEKLKPFTKGAIN